MNAKEISRRQMAAWEKSRVDYYNKEGYLDGHGLGIVEYSRAFTLGCVYYVGKKRGVNAWEFRLGDLAGSYVVWSRSLAKALREVAKEWQGKHSGAKFAKRLLAAAKEVRPDFVRADGLLYGSNGMNEFYMHDDRNGKDVLVLYLDERGYLLDADGNQLKA